MDIGHTWYEETPHSKPKKAEPQQKLLEFPAIVLSNKVLIIIIVSIITVFAGVLFVHQPGANHAPRASSLLLLLLLLLSLLLLLLLLLL